jgi:PAS domain S-box-containing protein
MRTRVVIADPDRGFRESLSAMLVKDPSIEVVATLGDGAELLARVVQEMPDIVCMNINMLGLNGIEATRYLRAFNPELKIVGMSAKSDAHSILDLLDAGALGYVSKNQGLNGVLHAIYSVKPYRKMRLSPSPVASTLPAHDAVVPSNASSKASADELERLRQIVDGSPIASFVIDLNHVVTHWNVACEALTGVPALDVLGTRKHWQAFCHEECPVMADVILDGMRGKRCEQFTHEKFQKSDFLEGSYMAEEFIPCLGESGRWIFSTTAPVRERGGEIIGMIQALQDVTGRRQADYALKANEERYLDPGIPGHPSGS